METPPLRLSLCIKGVFQLKHFKLRTDFIITCAQFEGFVLSPSQFFAIVEKVRQNVMNWPLQFDRSIEKTNDGCLRAR